MSAAKRRRKAKMGRRIKTRLARRLAYLLLAAREAAEQSCQWRERDACAAVEWTAIARMRLAKAAATAEAISSRP